MSEERLLQLFKEIKPTYKVNTNWLEQQRARLLGAIEVTEEHGLLQRLAEDIRIWWEELPYYWASARPALALVSAVAVGVLVGVGVFVDVLVGVVVGVGVGVFVGVLVGAGVFVEVLVGVVVRVEMGVSVGVGVEVDGGRAAAATAAAPSMRP